jgi:hypothetical protein
VRQRLADNGTMKSFAPALLVVLAALVACSPKLDWREVRPEGAGLLLLFPCKPEVASRELPQVRMGQAACKADEQSFSLTWARLDDPARVGPALQQMRESLAERLQAAPTAAQALQVAGMTPNPQAVQQQLKAETQQARVAVFARGLMVYQLVLLGSRADAAAWDNLLGGLKFEQ